MPLVTLLKLFWTAAQRWWEDNTFLLGAALAYYAVFSLAPVVLIAITIAGLVFDEQAARSQILEQINNTAGPQVGQAIEKIVQTTQDRGATTLATIISVVMLLIGATTVFAQLQDALNTIWRVKARPGNGFLAMLKVRFFSFTVVLGIGFLLLISLILSAAVAALSEFITPTSLPGGAALWWAIHWLVALGITTVLFALIYKLLPDVPIQWKDVWVGAAVTALLFSFGRTLIGIYLGQSSWISSYGAAGSLVVILLWVYYSSQIFLYGAEFTYVYANQFGETMTPLAHADRRPEKAPAPEGPSSGTREGQTAEPAGRSRA